MALAWVAAVPPAGTVLGPWQRLIRVLLPALAVAEVLQVYPVAGTQVVASTVMFGPVAAICIADGWRLLEQRLPATRGISPETVRYVGSVAAITLAVSLVWTQVVRNGINSAVAYADRKPLPFPEASRMRLSDGEVSTFTQLVAAGLVIWATAARFGPAWANPSGPPNVIPMALAWVAAVPPAGTVLGPWQRLLRVLLPALAVAEVLQVYPVAGTQVVASTVMFGPVGAICIADGWRLLEQRLPATRGVSAETVRYVGAVAAITLAVSLVWTQVVRNGINSAVAYADRKPLPFPVASRMRLSDGEVSTFTQLVAAIRNTRCTSLIMYPSYNSLYLWSGVPTPKPTLPGAWFEQMDDKTQQRAVDEVRASPRPCAIRNDQGAAAWLGPRPMPDTPGTRYITRDFKVAGTVGSFQFLVPKQG
jgi:hypothetical protein